MEKLIKLLCECDSFGCPKTVEVPVSEAVGLMIGRHVIIVDGCQKGANPTDVFVRKGFGYTLYEEG